MFDKKRYITRGVLSTVPSEIVLFLWSLIDEMLQMQAEHELDYLQVFNLWEDKDSIGTPVQAIRHSQEEHKAIYNLYLPIRSIINKKIYIIDSISCSTMLLDEEY